jgi:hypothetical protein
VVHLAAASRCVCKVHAQALVYAPERLLQLQGVALTAVAAGVVLVVEADACNSAAVAAAEPPCTYNSSTNAQALVFAPERLLQMQGIGLSLVSKVEGPAGWSVGLLRVAGCLVVGAAWVVDCDAAGCRMSVEGLLGCLLDCCWCVGGEG